MKKPILITAIAILLIATPAFAKNDNPKSNAVEHANNGKSQNAEHASTTLIIGDEISPTTTPTETPTITPTITPTTTPSVSPSPTKTDCDPNAVWKNHGAYVSCVAHLHEGGHKVSEAARSDVGKKNPTLEPSPSATPSPITSAITTLGESSSPLGNIGALIGKFFGFLKHLI
jgi:hypothetical protein